MHVPASNFSCRISQNVVKTGDDGTCSGSDCDGLSASGLAAIISVAVVILLVILVAVAVCVVKFRLRKLKKATYVNHIATVPCTHYLCVKQYWSGEKFLLMI